MKRKPIKKSKPKSKAPKRPNWDNYFLELAELVSKRSTCMRRAVGAVVVKDKHILATGYNGAPKDITHCDAIGCLREKLNIPSGQRHELCRGLHAEQNAIIQAALYGVSLKGATLYCTNLPCSICIKMIINSGIKNIIPRKGYPDKMTGRFLKEAEIKVKYIKKQKNKII
ncbi:MAG: cytidine deaminase [Candidatus Omnitrophica bacterium]|nr:cytidine deaminase [Candidatus Omnitrophota bacterium]